MEVVRPRRNPEISGSARESKGEGLPQEENVMLGAQAEGGLSRRRNKAIEHFLFSFFFASFFPPAYLGVLGVRGLSTGDMRTSRSMPPDLISYHIKTSDC